jgi:hypothetical protein
MHEKLKVIQLNIVPLGDLAWFYRSRLVKITVVSVLLKELKVLDACSCGRKNGVLLFLFLHVHDGCNFRNYRFENLNSTK